MARCKRITSSVERHVVRYGGKKVQDIKNQMITKADNKHHMHSHRNILWYVFRGMVGHINRRAHSQTKRSSIIVTDKRQSLWTASATLTHEVCFIQGRKSAVQLQNI